MPGLVDVAIVGGGVAGCAAALTSAGQGLAIAMVAPTVERRDRIGEFLSPAGNALLHELGLAEEFAAGPHRPANATYASWGSELLAERNAIVHTEGPGHVLDRAAFETMLSDAVTHHDVTIVTNSMIGVERADDIWAIGLTGSGTIRARFVIDCSGRSAVVGKGLGVRRRADRLVAAYTFLPQRDDTVEPTQATLIEATESGWWYASLLRDQRLAVAFFGDPDTLPRHISRDVSAWRAHVSRTRYIQRWVDTGGYGIETTPILASAGTTWLEPAAGPGWAAAGDAAAAFDPLSSHGITSALWTGRRSATAALAYLAGDPEPLARYAATLESAVQEFMLQRKAVYAREQRWRSQPFWQRRI